MNKDLGFSPWQFGFGAGIFFLGYVLCELPSNLMLVRFGARRWIARILISWGLLSAATMFVWNPASFYTVRTLLGAAEAGFFPGIIFYMTLWFPRAERAAMFATFNIAVPVSSLIGAPVSGLVIEHLGGAAGLAGWQWMFLLEGAPAVIMGLVVLFALPDTPRTAAFLAPDERLWLATRLDTERAAQERAGRFTVAQALTDPRVLLMCFICVGLVMGTTGIAIWMPQFIHAYGLSNLQSSLVTAIPAAFMAVSMIVTGRSADRTGERVWHTAGPFLVSAAGFVIAALTDSPLLGIAGLTIGAAGIGGGLTESVGVSLHLAHRGGRRSRHRADQLRRQHRRVLRPHHHRLGPRRHRRVQRRTASAGCRHGRHCRRHPGAGAFHARPIPPGRHNTKGRSMKVSAIRLHHLSAPLTELMGNALTFFQKRDALLVEVIGSDGTTGWGEAGGSAPAPVAAAIAATFAPVILGQDPAQTGRLWHAMRHAAGHYRQGVHSIAIAALDMALHDLAARARGVPVSTLLGGAIRSRIMAYASGPFFRPDGHPYRQFPQDVEAYARIGFRAFKLRIGFNPADDAAVVAKVRDIIAPTPR